jgi:hypothetical protein
MEGLGPRFTLLNKGAMPMFEIGRGKKENSRGPRTTVYTAGQEKPLPSRRLLASRGDFSDMVAAASA